MNDGLDFEFDQGRNPGLEFEDEPAIGPVDLTQLYRGQKIDAALLASHWGHDLRIATDAEQHRFKVMALCKSIFKRGFICQSEGSGIYLLTSGEYEQYKRKRIEKNARDVHVTAMLPAPAYDELTPAERTAQDQADAVANRRSQKMAELQREQDSREAAFRSVRRREARE